MLGSEESKSVIDDHIIEQIGKFKYLRNTMCFMENLNFRVKLVIVTKKKLIIILNFMKIVPRNSSVENECLSLDLKPGQ